MDLARVRSRVVLSALSGLALAAVLAGCAAPSDSDKARFNSVAGVVLDTAGNPVPNATINVIQSPSKAGATALGTTNYYGDTGPWITDANGRFVIDGVQINTTTPTVMNLRASKVGYVPGVVTYTVPTTVTVAGRTFTAGTDTPDLVVVGAPITTAHATLAPAGAVAQVGPGGNAGNPIVVGLPVARSRQAITGSASLVFPAGALTQTETVTFTALNGTALPAQAPFVSGATVGSSSSFGIAGPLFAADIELDPALAGPTAAPVTLTASLPLTVDQLAGQQLVLRQLSATGTWQTLSNTVTVSADPATGRAMATVGLTSFGFLMITQTDANAPRWVTGAESATGTVEDFPPIAEYPNGYVVPHFLSKMLTVNGIASDESAYLANDYASGALEPANGAVPVLVGATSGGVRATQYSFPFTVSYTVAGATVTRTGTRTTWRLTEIPLPPVATPGQTHFQGHVQGSGSSF